MIQTLTVSLAIFGATASLAADSPSFAAERLLVPRVDSVGQVAQYQDGTLTRLPSGEFRLDGVDTLDMGKVYQLPGIQSVEVRTIGTGPVSVLLRVNGVDPSCDHVSPLRFSQRRTGNRFDVVISSRHLYDKSPSYGCIDSYRPFRVTVPLDVYGLSSGTYTFSVNGVQTGQFALASENRYPDDCHETLERQCPK